MASSSGTGGSKQILDEEKQSVLDEVTRNRQEQEALEALEADNSHEETQKGLVMSKQAPKFEEKQAKKPKSAEYFKQKYNKPLQELIQMDKEQNPEPPNYSSVAVGPSELPQRYFCALCGSFAEHNCVSCGARFCSLQCLDIHKETKCLKWIV